jgi:uncharacterized protein (TIGR02391 family)
LEDAPAEGVPGVSYSEDNINGFAMPLRVYASALSTILTSGMIHPKPSGLSLVVRDAELRAAVASSFTCRDYNSAIFHAFRVVEMRVRQHSGLAEAHGVRLMRMAFHPDGGPLRNAGKVRGERQAISDLFAGAMGALRNPVAHQEIEVTSTEALALLGFADHLLRMVP